MELKLTPILVFVFAGHIFVVLQFTVTITSSIYHHLTSLTPCNIIYKQLVVYRFEV